MPSSRRMLPQFHGMALEDFQNIVAVLVRVAMAVMRHCDQKQHGEERVNSSYFSLSLFTNKGS